MDRVGDDAWKSVRLAWEAERWLPVGVPLGALAFVLWVGLTGAAVGFLAELGGRGITVDPWTPATDVVAGVLFLGWIVAPAAIATWLVRDRLTTVRGTLEIGYRLHHPILLLVPPAVVLATGTAALVGFGRPAVPVVALLFAGSIWFLVRTVAYSYRVFAFSVPILTYAMTMLTAGLLAVGTLVAGARLIGRVGVVESVVTSLAIRTESPALVTLIGGTVEFAGVDVPALSATVIGVPVALAMAYVAVQLAASLVARLVKPTTRRPQLRSGQRYPEFARPTTDVTPPATPVPDGPTAPASAGGDTEPDPDRGSSADEPTETGAADVEPDSPDTEPHLSNTRVFTAEDDAPPPSSVASDDRCPDCGTTVDASTGTCPDCGAEV